MKRTVPGIIAAVLLSLLAATGCAGNPMSEEAIQQTVEEIVAANLAVETTTFDLTMEATIDIQGPGGTEQTSVSGSGSGVVDSANQRMHMVMSMTTSIPGQSPLEIPIEYFLVDGWMYMSVDMPGQDTQWMKLRMPEGMWEQQDQVQQQVDLLKAADEVNYFGTEDVNGVDCYVVEIVPNLDSVRKMMGQMQGQMPAMGDLDLSSMDLGQIVKQVSMTQYIAVDGYLFMRTDQHMLIELTPAALGIPEGEFDVIVEDITTTMVFGDYNKPATIQMPQGALAATQIGT
ncbi:MAG: hypothetical protein M0R22_08785 [Dehalococcoidia bacterium]|jgi:hypothetical protein|nr:hypothetical protein [Dehalococcoidia bacterium]